MQFVADDVYDAARLKSACQASCILLVQQPDADLVLGTQGISLDWQGGDLNGALHVSEGAQNRLLIECIGPVQDAPGVKHLIADLGCDTVFSDARFVPTTVWLAAYVSLACERLLLTGSTPAEIDSALEAAGFALGPFAAQDRDGVDTELAARAAVLAQHGVPDDLPLFARAVSVGRLGRKAGVGWYRYPGGVGPVEDPLVEDLAAEEAHYHGHLRADLTDDAIVAAVFEAMETVRKDALSAGYTVQDIGMAQRHLYGISTCSD